MAILPPNPELILRPTRVGQINTLCYISPSHLLAGTEKRGVFVFDLIVGSVILIHYTQSPKCC